MRPANITLDDVIELLLICIIFWIAISSSWLCWRYSILSFISFDSLIIIILFNLSIIIEISIKEFILNSMILNFINQFQELINFKDRTKLQV